MKILYITTIGPTMGFFKSFIKELVEAGHTVDLACNQELAPIDSFYDELGCKEYQIDCTRSPFAKSNIDCIKQIKKLVEDNQYDIVHCHTPIAAACTRIACKGIRKQRANTDHPLRVFYTAHGFHFYKGAPKKNWIIFYPIEKLCARWTDTLITINKEDYNLAKEKFESSTCKVEYVPGVGIDVDKLKNTQVDRAAKRHELGVPEDAFLLLSVGELNENKNHQIVIRALADLMKTDEGKAKNCYYVIAGEGSLKGYLRQLTKDLDVEDRVFLLGFRKDCAELYKTADLFIHPSLREGLPVSVMEAEAAGLTCVGSNIRGNQDLMNAKNLFAPTNVKDVANHITSVYENDLDISIVHYSNINSGMRKLYKQ